MEYKRNSGRKKQLDASKQGAIAVPGKKRFKSEKGKKQTKEDKAIQFSKSQEEQVIKQIKEDAKWLLELSKLEKFSREWIDTVALELLFQCMGKKEILSTNMFGQQVIGRVFQGKAALQVLNTIAKMNGHLFDVMKGTINQTVNGQIEHNHQHQIELKPDTNRTEQVFSILEACGALNPPKRLTKEDVEVISA